MTGVENFPFIGQGGIIWDRGDSFSKIINRGGQRGASSQGCLKLTGQLSLFSPFV